MNHSMTSQKQPTCDLNFQPTVTSTQNVQDLVANKNPPSNFLKPHVPHYQSSSLSSNTQNVINHLMTSRKQPAHELTFHPTLTSTQNVPDLAAKENVRPFLPPDSQTFDYFVLPPDEPNMMQGAMDFLPPLHRQQLVRSNEEPNEPSSPQSYANPDVSGDETHFEGEDEIAETKTRNSPPAASIHASPPPANAPSFPRPTSPPRNIAPPSSVHSSPIKVDDLPSHFIEHTQQPHRYRYDIADLPVEEMNDLYQMNAQQILIKIVGMNAALMKCIESQQKEINFLREAVDGINSEGREAVQPVCLQADFPMLRCKSEEEIERFSSIIANELEMRKKIYKGFRQLGGGNRSTGDHIRHMLSTVITNKLAMSYSFCGRGENNKFESFAFSEIMLNVVRSYPHTQLFPIKEFQKCVTNWLRNSKRRLETEQKAETVKIAGQNVFPPDYAEA